MQIFEPCYNIKIVYRLWEKYVIFNELCMIWELLSVLRGK